MNRCWMATVVLAALTAISPATAAIVTLDFSGTLTDAAGTAAVGDRFGGTIVYDDSRIGDYQSVEDEEGFILFPVHATIAYAVGDDSFGPNFDITVRYDRGRLTLGRGFGPYLQLFVDLGSPIGFMLPTASAVAGASGQFRFLEPNGTDDAPSGGGPVTIGATVPDPATWQAMLLGFGVLGAISRRARARCAYS